MWFHLLKWKSHGKHQFWNKKNTKKNLENKFLKSMFFGKNLLYSIPKQKQTECMCIGSKARLEFTSRVATSIYRFLRSEF